MQQIVWHDGKIKNVHVDVPTLHEYQVINFILLITFIIKNFYICLIYFDLNKCNKNLKSI